MKFRVNFCEPEEMKFRVNFCEPEEMKVCFGSTQTLTQNDYHQLINKPTINSVVIDGDIALSVLGLRAIYYGTREYWDTQLSLIAQEGALYIYSDYQTIVDDVGNVTNLAGIKIGDGSAYLIDIPFITDAMSSALFEHISNTDVHTTLAEKQFWNNKVSSYLDHSNTENLIFSKVSYESDGTIITI